MIKPGATHSLVLDSVLVSFSLANGTLAECETAHTKWSKKIKASKWVTLPGDAKAILQTAHIVALRVSELPPKEAAANRLAQDPRNVKFVEGAASMGDQLRRQSAAEYDDMGYK